MAHLLITLILLAPPFLSGPKVAARLKPDSRSRTWVRGAPLPEVDTPASFLALSFMESSLFPSSSGKPLTKERAQRKLPQELSWLKGMKYPDIPVTFDPHTIKYLKWFRFNRTGRNVIRDWIEKSGKYRKMVISTLKRHHLPTALMYIALIESGYVKTTRSWAGALGLWQFMPSGTKVYGLAKSYWIDQRIDPELSTEAAMLYFADLHYRFKNWALAMGAYNCGYGRMLQSMRRYSTNDYFKLSSYENALPRETRLYVPKMQAVAIADINRKLFKIDSLKMAPPYSFEVIHLPGGVSLATLAHITGISFATLWDLNREYIRKRLPPGKGRWPVRLPPGTLARAKNRIAKQTPGWFKHSVYEVQLGDTLPSIARMFGTTTMKLRQLNSINTTTQISLGLLLVVPTRKGGPLRQPAATEKPLVSIPADATTPEGHRPYFYYTTRSDTLVDIAKGLGIPMEKIAAWNLLSPSAGITYNMYLLVYLPGGKKPHQALLSLEQVRLIRIDREAFFAHYLKKSHKVRIVHRVRRGDTLKKLARRYGTTRRFIRSLNRYAKKDVSPGENLIIYAKSSTVSKSQRKKISPGEKKPLPRMKHPGKTKPAIPTLRGPKKVLHQQGMTKKPGSKASSLKRIPHRTVTPSLVSSGITENLTSKFPTDISNQKALAWRGSPAPNTSKKSKKRPQPARSTPPPKKAKKAAGHGK